jgi:hypothetical protein
MTQTIILMLKSKSEKEFFKIIAENRIVNLKYLYRKVCRQQVYEILKKIKNLQDMMNIKIYEKNADFCKITGLPIINITFLINIIIRQEKNNYYVFFNN